MKNKQIIPVVFVMFITLVLSSCGVTSKLDRRGTVCFKDKCINVEVASNFRERSIGLQYRSSLGKNEGMLFVFEESSFQGFWMKETFIPLDIIWIDNSKEIVHIKRRVPPCEKDPCKVYKAPKIAKYVLEINSGYADTLGLMEGDIAVIDYE